ncbi:hypothetical protein L6164_011591 [Bauhinia variegata]|uniref:Uncharacterized protein n=1 Tax=Bauhinia variegata TaxID=167791 RepID=A0ACB9PA92_BAUVA|nr:hypothetical protein L6164_011591 [Bauhinia variegata]
MMRRRQNTPLSSLDENTTKSPDFSKSKDSRFLSIHLFSSEKRIFVFCLSFRMLNALLVQTYFNPDEHWQGPEVAHRIAFGYGHLTWEWAEGIRSYLHPMVFVVLYRILALFRLDNPWLMMKAPRLLQSLFSAVGDLYLYKLSQVLFGDHVAKWALFSQLSNWFMFYCFPRTLSNCLETVLTLVSLYFWPCMRSSGNYSFLSRKWSLAFAALACAIRPTSAITWLYVGLLELLSSKDTLIFLSLEVVPIGILVLGLTYLLDCFMYGSWILVPLNFLKFNFLSSGGDYYDNGSLLASLLGFWGLTAYLVTRSSAVLEDPGSPQDKGKGSSKSHTKRTAKLGVAILFLLGTNIPMALYMSLVHQRGPEEVMNHLAKEALDAKVKSILFLTPCHATPYYSMLHYNLPMQFLDCSPSEEKGVPDESDRFMMDPVAFVSEYAKYWSQPSHIVLFDSEEQKLRNFLMSLDYREEIRFFNAHFKVDRDLQASIVVYVQR